MVWLCVEECVGDAEFVVGPQLQQLLTIVIHLAKAKAPEAVWPGAMI